MSNRVNHYARAEEKFAKAVIVYTDGLNMYYDKELSIPVLKAELLDLYMDRMIIANSYNNYWSALRCDADNGVIYMDNDTNVCTLDGGIGPL